MPELTPGQTVGPFFHDALPYAGGGELVPPGTPDGVRLHGTVYDGAGDPVPDALLELRQADAQGRVPRIEGSIRRTGAFTGWGRAATDADGRYTFTTIEPGGVAGGASFFALTVFARGLLDRLFTRAYLPGESDGFLAALPEAERDTLQVVREDDGSVRFDVRLQGEGETVFIQFPRQRG